MNMRILVVDDSHVERILIEGLLRKQTKYEVQLAVDGLDALEQIAARPPDLIITDLVMPELNGLQLVRRVRAQYADIPLIVVTAFGDESTAVAALEAGAANYIPKAEKAERLVAAVKRVLEHSRNDQMRARLGRSMLEYHCRFELENDRYLIRELVNQLQQVMAGLGFMDAVERIRTCEALEEALLNAMYHGNLEISQDELTRVRTQLDEQALDRLVEEHCRDERLRNRRILAIARINAREARFVVRDEGRGFDTHFDNRHPPERFAAGEQHGMTVIHSLMDVVSFNQSGNELVICKRARGMPASERQRHFV